MNSSLSFRRLWTGAASGPMSYKLQPTPELTQRRYFSKLPLFVFCGGNRFTSASPLLRDGSPRRITGLRGETSRRKERKGLGLPFSRERPKTARQRNLPNYFAGNRQSSSHPTS